MFSVVFGSQFGDEGKGKIIDFLSKDFDFVIRYQGGDNAGHTLMFKGLKYVFNTIPSGIFNTNVVIAPGVVINPINLLSEIDNLKNTIDVTEKKILIADKTNIIFEFHILWDVLCEKVRKKSSIGCTHKGIGPCYSDKTARFGITASDLLNYDILLEKLQLNLSLKNPIFKKYNFITFDAEEVAQKYYELGQILKPYLINYFVWLQECLRDKKTLLLEGSQGLMLDLDLGTYPYVTSSNIISSVNHGAYLPINKKNEILSVVKAYSSRVGNGTLITEIQDVKIFKYIQKRGFEFGSVTNRPRRIGWLDLVAIKYSITLSGADSIALTLVDVLSGLKEVKICIAYNDENGNSLPFNVYDTTNIVPVYKLFHGWFDNFNHIMKYDDFSSTLKEYISFIEDYLGVKVKIISYGKEKESTLYK